MNLATTLRLVNFKNDSVWQRRYYIMNHYEMMAKELHVGINAILSPWGFEEICDRCDGLIIPGSGMNIPTHYYGGAPLPEAELPEVDEYFLDAKLIDYFHKAGKPILGICGGLQAINIFFGGSIKKLDDYVAHMNGDVKRHEIEIKRGSFVYDVFKSETATVNCYHNWEIDRLAEGFEVVARTHDGVIEAIENKEKRIYATQWHPEHAFEWEPYTERELFVNFLKHCENKK